MNANESVFAFLRRAGYALAVLVLGIPAFPLFICGVFLEENGDRGYFELAAVGAMFFVLIFSLPFLLIASGVKWIFTGRGLAFLS